VSEPGVAIRLDGSRIASITEIQVEICWIRGGYGRVRPFLGLIVIPEGRASSVGDHAHLSLLLMLQPPQRRPASAKWVRAPQDVQHQQCPSTDSDWSMEEEFIGQTSSFARGAIFIEKLSSHAHERKSATILKGRGDALQFSIKSGGHLQALHQSHPERFFPVAPLSSDTRCDFFMSFFRTMQRPLSFTRAQN
jgi:hypothetical protein